MPGLPQATNEPTFPASKGDVPLCDGGTEWKAVAYPYSVYDSVRETVTALANFVPNTLPAVARDTTGAPLEVAMPAWRAGDILEVYFSGTAFSTMTTPGDTGGLCPLVDVGLGFGYLDNGMQLGASTPTGAVVQINGVSCVRIQNFLRPPRVRLGLFLQAANPAQGLIITGGPMNFSAPVPVMGSTWLRARRLPAESVTTSVLPATVISALPVP